MASVCLPHESGTLSQRKHHRTFSRLIVSAVPFSPLWACHLEIACLPFFLDSVVPLIVLPELALRHISFSAWRFMFLAITIAFGIRSLIASILWRWVDLIALCWGSFRLTKYPPLALELNPSLGQSLRPSWESNTTRSAIAAATCVTTP